MITYKKSGKIPSMTTSEREAFIAPYNGYIVFDTNTLSLYFWREVNWRQITDQAG